MAGKGGRPKKPTELKVLHGTYRADRDAQPQNLAGQVLDKLPEPPEVLGRVGRQQWRSMGKRLIESNVLRNTDLETLRAWCQAFEQLQSAYKALRAAGADDIDAPFRRWEKAMSLVHRYSMLFGLNPSARSQIAMAGNDRKPTGVQPRQRNG